MRNSRSSVHAVPNIWHTSAVVWGTSILLLCLFSLPICLNQTGMRLQLLLMLAHFAGVFYLWRLGAKRGNPERLMHIAIVTLVFIYIVPLCMLVAPVIVLAAYALPSPSWKTVILIMLLAAVGLTGLRILSTAADTNTGRRFELNLADRLKGDTIKADSINTLLNNIGRHPTQPSRIDGWTMVAAIASAAPILSADIGYDKSSSSLAFCALFTTPMAMHAISRMAVHAYLWIYRLRRFEREVGFKVNVNLRDGN
jgi:hypothetical protein